MFGWNTNVLAIRCDFHEFVSCSLGVEIRLFFNGTCIATFVLDVVSRFNVWLPFYKLNSFAPLQWNLRYWNGQWITVLLRQEYLKRKRTCRARTHSHSLTHSTATRSLILNSNARIKIEQMFSNTLCTSYAQIDAIERVEFWLLASVLW